MIKIAMFGSEETINLVQQHGHRIDGIDIHPFLYDSVADIDGLLPQATHCDVYLFSGILSYVHAENLLEQFDKPAVYIEDNELNVSLTLLSVIHHKLTSLDRVSIDLPDRNKLDIIIEQLQITPKPTYVKDFSWIKTERTQVFESAPLLQFHVDLWNSGKTNFAITSIHAIYDQLVKLGIPCLRMVDAEKTIVDTLNKAKQAGVLLKTQLSQVAVSTISITHHDHIELSQEQLEPVVTGLQGIAKQINGSLQKVGPASFESFSTKGSVEFLMENSSLIAPLLTLASDLSIIIHIGTGFGMTIVEAKKNAAIALTFAEKVQDHYFIVVTEDKTVINPQVEMDNQVLSTEDEHVIHLAKTAKVSVPNMIKMMQFLKSRPVNRITSGDIGDYFGITRRSAERMLKKYMDAGWLRVIGEEHPHQNGRPRSVYRLDLPQ